MFRLDLTHDLSSLFLAELSEPSPPGVGASQVKRSGCVGTRTFSCLSERREKFFFRGGGDVGAKEKRKSAEKPQRRHVGERRSVRGEEEEEARSENVSFRASVCLFS